MTEHFKLLEPAFSNRTLTPHSGCRPLHVVSFGRSGWAARGCRRSRWLRPLPPPAGQLRQVLAVLLDVLLVLDQPVADALPEVRGTRPELWQSIDDIERQVVAVELVQHHHVER